MKYSAMTKKKYQHGISCYSGSLFKFARDEYHRSIADDVESEAVIIFSALAVEAFLNDLVGLAQFHVKDDAPETLKAFAAIMPDLDEQRVQIRARFLTAAYILSGKSPDKGSKLIQNLELLIRLRNELVHTKPEPIPDLDNSQKINTPHKLIKPLMDQGVIQLNPPLSPAFWRRWISCPDVAAWSFNVAVCACKHLVALLPAGWFKQHMESFAKDILIEVQVRCGPK